MEMKRNLGTLFLSLISQSVKIGDCKLSKSKAGGWPRGSVPVAKLMPRFNPWSPHGGELIPQLHCRLFS